MRVCVCKPMPDKAWCIGGEALSNETWSEKKLCPIKPGL